MAALSTLERRIDKHLKESTDQIKYFRSELQCLKSLPKPRVARPASELIKTREVSKNKRLGESAKVSSKSSKGVEKIADIKTSMKLVNFYLSSFTSMKLSFNHF